ncbi:unnamed protein product [Ectocarpus sp. CCAP 1310/34]|nr:unnamed protein product [Ectocarpus sp. CCAP 1310/34]
MLLPSFKKEKCLGLFAATLRQALPSSILSSPILRQISPTYWRLRPAGVIHCGLPNTFIWWLWKKLIMARALWPITSAAVLLQSAAAIGTR